MKRLILASVLLCIPVIIGGWAVITTDNGAELHWPASSIPRAWYLDTDGSDDFTLDAAEQALKNAHQVWNDIPCSKMEFSYAGRRDFDIEDCGAIPPDKQDVMIWMESNWPAEWQGAIGIAQPVYNPTTGAVEDCDIFFNGDDFTWSATDDRVEGQMDLWNIAAHEIGHKLGLGHPGESDNEWHYEATMHPTSTSGEIARRYPALDDMQGVCHLYNVAGENGNPCTGNSDCNSGVCQPDPLTEQQYCTKSCTVDEECPPAFRCSTDAGYCIAQGGAIAGFGDECDEGFPCAEGLFCLLSSGTDESMCTTYCPPDCPDGYKCIPLQGGKSACWRINTWGLQLGEDCTQEECRADYQCLNLSNQGIRCTRSCPPECPEDFECLNLSGGGSVCWQEYLREAEMGRECTWDKACADEYCLKNTETDVMRCSAECTSDADCSDGYTCISGTHNTQAAQGCWPANLNTGTASITSFTSSPVSPMPMGSATLTCSAQAPNTAVYQIFRVEEDKTWTPLSDFGPNGGTATVDMNQEGTFEFVCKARDMYSGLTFDQLKYIDITVVKDIPVVDGDVDDGGDSVIGQPEDGSSSCAAGSSVVFPLMLLLGYGLRRKFRNR